MRINVYSHEDARFLRLLGDIADLLREIRDRLPPPPSGAYSDGGGSREIDPTPREVLEAQSEAEIVISHDCPTQFKGGGYFYTDPPLLGLAVWDRCIICGNIRSVKRDPSA